MHTSFNEIIEAQRHSNWHRPEIEMSKRCGCFFCLEIFHPDFITEWMDANNTALCPVCGTDSVIGSASGYAITKHFLENMNRHWF
jgi:hypothetical protein